MLEGLDQSQTSFQVWDDSSSARSATLPRRHRRQASGDSSSLLANSTPRSSRRHRSPCSTLPRSKCSSLSRCTSRASVLPPNTGQDIYQNRGQGQTGKHSTNSSPSRSGGSSGSVRASNGSPGKTGTLGRSVTRHGSRRPSHDSTGSGTKSSNSSPQHKVSLPLVSEQIRTHCFVLVNNLNIRTFRYYRKPRPVIRRTRAESQHQVASFHLRQ